MLVHELSNPISKTKQILIWILLSQGVDSPRYHLSGCLENILLSNYPDHKSFVVFTYEKDSAGKYQKTPENIKLL